MMDIKHKLVNLLQVGHDKPSILPEHFQVEKVILDMKVQQAAIRACQRRTPNEYAFMCAGKWVDEQTVSIDHFYAPKSEVNTRYACTISSQDMLEFFVKRFPNEYTITIWGHSHHRFDLSMADKKACSVIAGWERSIFAWRRTNGYSLSMTIQLHTWAISFFDIYTYQPIDHEITIGQRRWYRRR